MNLKNLSDDVLQISVTYKEDPTLREMGTQSILVGLEEVNQIQCSSCHTPLLSGQPIKRTSELPTGHWDDIADYLICYSGVRQSILQRNALPNHHFSHQYIFGPYAATRRRLYDIINHC